MSIAEKLQTVAENEQKVFDTGYERGKADGKDTIIEQLASTVQRGGSRTDFSYAFNSSTVTDDTMRELLSRWSATIKTASYMFISAENLSDGLYTDALDFSNCESLLCTFSNSKIKKLKIIDARKTRSGHNGMANMFWNCTSLETIDEFYPSNRGTQTGSYATTGFSGTFGSCTALKRVIFMSEIVQNGLNLQNSTKLDKESLTSVINQLSSEAEEKSVTLPLEAVNREFETSEGAIDGSTSAEWTALTGAKTNWTINLV